MSNNLPILAKAILSVECRHHWNKFGTYVRKSDQKRLQRWRCRDCGDTYSDATSDKCYGQHKRSINPQVFALLVSGVSQRRAAKILSVNLKTIVRKFLFIGQDSMQVLHEQNVNCANKVTTVEFDDLETFEHSKLKPLSVILAVEHKTRRILGFEVSQMAAKGKLAKLSLKKYGRRKDHRKSGRGKLFESIRSFVAAGAIFKSDENPHYQPDVKSYFPESTHFTFKGRRGCVVGQGELKRGGFDPLFSLNHTCAKLRADINRLFRRTWCTTKKAPRLGLHIAMMAVYHNHHIIRSNNLGKK